MAQTYTILAVRVAFSDTPVDSSTAYYDRLLFFLNQYWSQQSDGQVTLTTTLWDSVFTLPRPMAYYGDDNHFQERLVFMVRDLIALADSTVNFSQYQGLYIFHAGAGQEADVLDNSREQIWSAFITPDDFDQVLPDSTGATGIKTNDQTSPGVFYRVTQAVESPEVESQDGYAFGPTGVVCHEFGHMLGRLRGQPSMPDLYDTTPDDGGYNQGIGNWDIMGGGVWNANGFVPAGLSAWSRYWMGFLAPTRVVATGPQTLSQLERQAASDPRILQIPITQSEYFLIENRQRDLDGNGKFTFDDVNGDGCFDFYTDSYAGAEYDFFLPANLTPPGAGVRRRNVRERVGRRGVPRGRREDRSRPAREYRRGRHPAEGHRRGGGRRDRGSRRSSRGGLGRESQRRVSSGIQGQPDADHGPVHGRVRKCKYGDLDHEHQRVRQHHVDGYRDRPDPRRLAEAPHGADPERAHGRGGSRRKRHPGADRAGGAAQQHGRDLRLRAGRDQFPGWRIGARAVRGHHGRSHPRAPAWATSTAFRDRKSCSRP